MKKILVVLMMLCMVSAIAGAQTSGDWEYSYRNYGTDRTYYITKYLGTAESVVVPTELDGNAIGAIGDGRNSPFKDCSTVRSVEIPEGFTKVDNHAFESCSSIESILLPSTIKTIGSWAFYGCSNLTDITIPEGVTSIGEYAFYNCSKLTSIVIPEGITDIGREMFRGCIKLTSVTIPDGVTNIGYGAFRNCKSLTVIEIPISLKTMGSNVFFLCESLKSVSLPDDMTSIDWGDVGVVCNCHIGSQTAQLLGVASSWSFFYDENYPGLYFSYDYDEDEKIITGLALRDADETIVTAQIPPEVTRIGDSTFEGCKKLTSVVLPQALTSLGSYVFSGCTSLASYTLPDGMTDIGSYVHDENTTVCYCTLGSPASYALGKGHSTFADPAYDKLVLRYIYDSDTAAFTGLELVRTQDGIAEAAIPDGVTVIGDHALSGKSQLTSVTIPDSVTTIEGNAFLESPKLLSVTMPDHVTSIGNYIIEREKTIYCSVDSDTARALNADDSSAMFMDPQYPDYWLSYKHDGNTITGPVLSKAATHLVTVVIPDFVTDIGDYAFRDCAKVKSVRLPDGLKTIGRGAFSDSRLLSEISIPNGVTSIGRYAFNSAEKIKAYIPTSVQEIGEHAFPRSYNLPNGSRGGMIYCYQYSYAESWGNQNNVTVVLLDGKDFKSAGGTVSMPQTVYVGNGRSKTIAAEIFPKMSGLNITWKSSNTDVATVNSRGVVTAKKNGKTTITLNVEGITAKSTVTVVTPATDFTIPEDVFVQAGQATDAPTPVVYPSDATLDLTWEVADSVIAEVGDDGKITSHVVGETTITAADSVTGLRKTATLYTIRPVTSITLEPALMSLLPWQGAQLKSIVSADAFQFENQLITFTSSNKKVATVDANGWVQAKGPGTAVITARSENGISATSQITVSKANILKLPAALRVIDGKAFSSIAAEIIVLPDGIETISGDAFMNLSNVKLVVVPDTAATAAAEIFKGTDAVLVRPDGREIPAQ